MPAAVVCVLVGAAGFGAGLAIAPGRAWGAFLANFLFWTALSMAGVVLVATFNVAGAWWGRSIQRITSGLGAFTPVAFLLLGALWLGRPYLFSRWNAEATNGWLNAPVVFLRDAVILAVAAALIGWTLYRSLRPDLGALADEGRLERRGLAAFLLRNWQGRQVERAKTTLFHRKMSPVVLLWYTLGYSVLAIDLDMSINPTFRSTMFPVIYWIGAFYSAFAAASILCIFWAKSAPVSEVIGQKQVRDLGNMLWGCSIFWAYVTWAQYFVIWMANLPPEAAFLIERWRTGWGGLAWTMLVCSFIAPFFLLFMRGLKNSRQGVAVVGGIGMLGVLLQRFLDVMPGIPNLGPSTYGLVEVAITVGFVGIVALPYLWLMRRVPLFPIEDPLFLRMLETRGVEV
jgi:hypothetical protein